MGHGRRCRYRNAMVDDSRTRKTTRTAPLSMPLLPVQRQLKIEVKMDCLLPRSIQLVSLNIGVRSHYSQYRCAAHSTGHSRICRSVARGRAALDFV